MKLTLPIALLSAAVTCGLALAQRPTLVPSDIEGRAYAATQLAIQHDGSGGLEAATLPAGTEFVVLPTGPACPHWPYEGAGTAYTFEKGRCGLWQTYTGLDRVRVFAGDTGQTGLHINHMRVVSPIRIPGFVDVHIKSLVDSESWNAFAEVEVALYKAIVHDFEPPAGGDGETKVTVPVEFGPEGLDIAMTTFIYVDNKTAPTYQGLIDLDVKVTFRVPTADFVPFGVGCEGSNGVPVLRPFGGSLPAIGGLFEAEVLNVPVEEGMPVFGLLGLRTFEPPRSLAAFGRPDCLIYVDHEQLVPLKACQGVAAWNTWIPLNLALVDMKLYQQAFVFDFAGNKVAAVTSNYGVAQIGILPIQP